MSVSPTWSPRSAIQKPSERQLDGIIIIIIIPIISNPKPNVPFVTSFKGAVSSPGFDQVLRPLLAVEPVSIAASSADLTTVFCIVTPMQRHVILSIFLYRTQTFYNCFYLF